MWGLHGHYPRQRLVSRSWKKELETVGVNHNVATAGHFQTNGVAEHAVQIAKQTLKTLSD